MGKLQNPETLDEDGVVSKLGQAQNPRCKTPGLPTSSEKFSHSELTLELFLTGGNGGGFDTRVRDMGVSNVDVLNWGINTEKGIHCTECSSKESLIKCVKITDESVSKAGSEVNWNEEVLVVKKTTIEEEGMKGGNASWSNEFYPARKIEASGNGISLFVDVFGPPNQGEHVLRGGSSNHLDGKNGALLSGNEQNLSDNVSVTCDSMVGVMRNGIRDEEEKGGIEAQEGAICNQECKFSETAPLAGDGGSREGTLVQEEKMGELGENFSSQFEPVKFLAFVKCLAVDVSMPGKLEFAATRNCLSAFYSSVGHLQLLMHQLCGTTDVKDSAEGELKQLGVSVDSVLEVKVEDMAKLSGAKWDTVLEKCSSDFAEERICPSSKNKEGNKDSDVGNRSAEVADIDISKLASSSAGEMMELSISPTTAEGKVSTMLNDVGNGGKSEKGYKSRERRKSKSKVSTMLNDVGNGGKSEKGYKSRERRKSKYLLPPYTNNSWGLKNSPISEETETQDGKGVSHVGQGFKGIAIGESVGSAPIVKWGGKKLQKKRSRKAISGHATAGVPAGIDSFSVDMLSELRCAALDCLYPDENKNFDSVDRFFSDFRRSVFHDKSKQELIGEGSNQTHLPQALPGGEVPMDKAKGMVEESNEPQGTKPFAGAPDINKNADYPALGGKNTHGRSRPLPSVTSKRRRGKKNEIVAVVEESTEPWGTKPIAGAPDKNENADYLASGGKNTQGRSHPLPSVTSKRRRRKKNEIVTMGPTTPGFSDVNGNPNNGSFIINFQETSCLAPDNSSVPKKRKKKARMTLELLQAKVAVDLPDLNGNCTTPNSLVEDSQAINIITGLDKPELKIGGAPEHGGTKNIAGLENVNGNNAEVGSFLKDVLVMGPCPTQGVAELNNWAMKGSPSPYVNGELVANQPDTNGNNSERRFLSVKDPWQMGLLFPVGKPEPRKRKKRKEKAPADHLTTAVHSALPDLNGNAAESTPPAEVKTPRKRRRRNKSLSGICDINFDCNKVQTNGEALGTALLLKFAEGFPVPSKEALVAKFCGFGPLKELETQGLDDPGSAAQVVFMNTSDARNAFQSLEKSSPFGQALVNYRLHLPAASRALEGDTNLHGPETFRTMDGFRIPEKPHPGGSHDLSFIRKNLEMMTSMLEQAGNNISPEMRAKLETDVKGLLKKVSTMAGTSSSS